jgi:hypothetical protein
LNTKSSCSFFPHAWPGIGEMRGVERHMICCKSALWYSPRLC